MFRWQTNVYGTMFTFVNSRGTRQTVYLRTRYTGYDEDDLNLNYHVGISMLGEYVNRRFSRKFHADSMEDAKDKASFILRWEEGFKPW